MRWGVALAAGATLAACHAPPPDTHPQKVLTRRVEIFKQLNRSMEPLAQMARGDTPYQREAMLQMVQDLEQLSTKPWAFFPADGNYPPTRARPEVWSQPQAFERARLAYLDEVRALGAAVRAEDKPGMAAAAERTGRSCKSCHDSFRQK